jgi:hypothetical protein
LEILTLRITIVISTAYGINAHRCCKITLQLATNCGRHIRSSTLFSI